MALSKKLLSILVCPKCKGSLQLVDSDASLLCGHCKVKFAIKNDVPLMVMASSEDLSHHAHASKDGILSTPAQFKVISGVDEGLTFSLGAGTCRAIGRSAGDPNKTSVFSVDFTLSLDENTKKLVINYIKEQFRKFKAKGSSEDSAESSATIGGFKRSNDIILSDANLSRLHTMIFYDGNKIGLLDLVSKNGTHINGKEVESYILNFGDVIEIGNTKIICEER